MFPPFLDAARTPAMSSRVSRSVIGLFVRQPLASRLAEQGEQSNRGAIMPTNERLASPAALEP
jgi:hypothetical protein